MAGQRRTHGLKLSLWIQLAIELFDLKDTPDGDADSPKCAMGCLGGVPIHNGQIVDHAMPTGFRYKLWLLAASMSEWREVLPEKARHCLDFDFEYSVKFEAKLTPFEVGPAAWMCEFARLPRRIVQSPNKLSTEKLGTDGAEYIYGRSIWVRDRFGFPPEEAAVEDMEHEITLEASISADSRQCKSIKHPGPVPRQSVFCLLQPGTYSLTFYAEYPLGGLHPCSDFFAQVGLRPMALTDQSKRQSCLSQASDMNSLQVESLPVEQWQGLANNSEVIVDASTIAEFAARLWPVLSKLTEGIFVNEVIPKVNKRLPGMFNISLRSFSIGAKPPTFGQMRSKNQRIIETESFTSATEISDRLRTILPFIWDSQAQVDAVVAGFHVGVQKIQIKAEILVDWGPILDSWPNHSCG
eukprot:s4476_g1.t1